MTTELVIFDCDGVLVDSETITTNTIVEAVGAAGLNWAVDDVLQHFHGGKMADVIAAAEAELGAPLPEDFVDRFRLRLFERLRADVEAIPGVEAALDAISLPTCVASNGPRGKMEATLGSTGLLARFEGRIFSAYDIGSFKPDPGLFLHAAAEMGVRPEGCVVVEDSDNGVRAAVAAGMRVLAYVGHGFELHAAGAETFDTMAALPGLVG